MSNGTISIIFFGLGLAAFLAAQVGRRHGDERLGFWALLTVSQLYLVASVIVGGLPA